MKIDFKKNLIVLMVKNPHWAYSYWEIKQDSPITHCDLKENHIKESRKILRVYEIEKVDDFFYKYIFSKDEVINGDCQEWYFNLGGKNIKFFIEIGLKEREGRFLPLARSNCVTTANDELSKNREEKWVMPENNGILKEIKASKYIENGQINQTKSKYPSSDLSSLIKKHTYDYPLSSNSSENLFLKNMLTNTKTRR